MINTSKNIVFLKSDRELEHDIRRAISCTIILMKEKLDVKVKATNNCRMKRQPNLAFIQYFDKMPKNDTLNKKMIEAWYDYVVQPSSTLSKNNFALMIGKDESEINDIWVDELVKNMKGPIQIALLFLYCQKALLLTYQFPRIRVSWLEKDNLELPCYTECIRFIRSFDNHTNINETIFFTTAQHKTLEQLYGQGMKMLVASTWYTPEDITIKEIDQWRDSQKHCANPITELTISPLPIVNFISVFRENFGNRFISQHSKLDTETLRNIGRTSELRKELNAELIKELILSSTNPMETMLTILRSKRIFDSDFNSRNIEALKIPEVFKSVGIDIDNAFKCWIGAQEYFLEINSYESEGSQTIALGRFNIYLFIYLPLWLKQNPSLSHLYPWKPNQLKAGLHIAKKMGIPLINRPMSYLEFYGSCEFHWNWSALAPLRKFFCDIATYHETLEGCKGFIQPMHKQDMPRSKKYNSVQKNTFSRFQLILFIRFLYGLEALQTYILQQEKTNNRLTDRLENESRNIINTAEIGFVPIACHGNANLPITQIDKGFMSFVKFKQRSFYYPGLLRHAITLIETGLRGQAIQWLDNESYDKGCDRTNMHPLDLNSLWVNTDKSQNTGFYSYVSNRVLVLLDEQKAWREKMISKGANALKSPVFYDGNPVSKWGKITPLFSKNLATNEPLTDSDYSSSWTSLCFSFQLWLSEHDIDNTRLVAHIPSSSRKNKKFFTWEEWEAQINEADVKILDPEESNWGTNPSGKFCPVSLRSFITPHGARASFVSSLITVLPAEYIGAYLTGQKLQTVHYYAKPDEKFIESIRQKHRNEINIALDAKEILSLPDDTVTNKQIMRRIVDSIRNTKKIEDTIYSNGLISLKVNANSKIKMTGLEMIAADKASAIGEADTHLCPCNFECPKEIIEVLKFPKRCSLCPYAIFPVDLLPRISAKRHQLAETVSGIQKKLEVYASSENVSQNELTELEDSLNCMAEDAIGWRLVEESLWNLVEQRRNGLTNQNHIIAEPSIVTNYLMRISAQSGTSEEFVLRLKEVAKFPNTNTPEIQAKFDQAKRLLIAGNGDTVKALLEPPTTSSAAEVVGLMRSTMEYKNINVEEVLRLLTMSPQEWAAQLSRHHSPEALILSSSSNEK